MKNFVILFLCGVLLACGQKKKAVDEQVSKPMRIVEGNYSAYHADGDWALEMELNGNFAFKDYVNNISFYASTPLATDFLDEGKQGKLWTMTSGEQELRLKVYEENCFSLSFTNNRFLMEILQNNQVIYSKGDCGSYHEKFGFGNTYVFTQVSGITIENPSLLPKIVFHKTPLSNQIYGKIGCRSFKGELLILETAITIGFDIHPTENCIEDLETQRFMEVFPKKYYFSFERNNTILRLIDKNHTFVLKK